MSTVSKQIRLDNVRCSFLNAIKPKAFPGQEERYSASFLIPKDDKDTLKLVQSAIVEVANGRWKASGPGVLKQLQGADKLCIHDGDAKMNGDGEAFDGYPGHWFVNASAPQSSPPKVFRGRDQVTPENVAKFRDGVPYSGCFVHALVTIWAQDNNYGKRVNASLDAVLFASDGPRFGGGGVSTGAALDAFADLIDDEAHVAAAEPAAEDGDSLFGD